MKKKYLLYIPNGLYTPEFEIMLSKAQILIDEKKDVEIVTLGGGGFNGEVYAIWYSWRFKGLDLYL